MGLHAEAPNKAALSAAMAVKNFKALGPRLRGDDGSV